jgi:hypothetical protein
MFDVTIVAQTVIYRPRRLRRASVSVKPHAVAGAVPEDEEEAAGLLRGDALAESVESLSRRTASSVRTAS